MTDAPRLSPTRILMTMILGMIAFTGAFAIIGYFLREPLMIAATLFVEYLQGPGVAIGFFLPDAFTVPLPNDAFSALGIAGGMDFWVVVLWSAIGSVSGGATGFTIGRSLSRTRWFQKKFRTGKGAAIQEVIERYGGLGLAIAACTPLPYSLATWAAGTTKMSFGQFLAISIPLRTARIAAMLWLVQVGLAASAG
ncbi:MAG: VTT domain-containing protein [Nannocystaceae bacterium]